MPLFIVSDHAVIVNTTNFPSILNFTGLHAAVLASWQSDYLSKYNTTYTVYNYPCRPVILSR